MATGATPGSCVCPEGTALVDGICVKKIVCDSPLVPNADGTACVRKPTEKKKTRSDRECKNGQVKVRGKCREPERKSRDLESPSIRIPGGFGGGVRGGGSPQGGGATPGKR
jgi:hypothetical protein